MWVCDVWGKNKNKRVIVVQLSYQIQKSRLWCSQSSSSTDTTSRLSVSNSSFFKRQFLDFTGRCHAVTCRCRPEAILLITLVKWPTVWWTSIDSLRGTTADFFLPAGCWRNCQPAPSSSYTWRRRAGEESETNLWNKKVSSSPSQQWLARMLKKW